MVFDSVTIGEVSSTQMPRKTALSTLLGNGNASIGLLDRAVDTFRTNLDCECSVADVSGISVLVTYAFSRRSRLVVIAVKRVFVVAAASASASTSTAPSVAGRTGSSAEFREVRDLLGVRHPVYGQGLGVRSESFGEFRWRQGAERRAFPLFLEQMPMLNLVIVRQCGRFQTLSNFVFDGLVDCFFYVFLRFD